MHDIEPYYYWREEYTAAEDRRSPFYGRRNSETHFTHKIYNYYIHPQWDAFGSSTLYGKLLFADYEENYAILELIGEWNDCLHNDVMYLKRYVIDPLVREGIYKFILICEHVLNFHGDDDSYYEEWYEDVSEEQGWVVLLNTLEHVCDELKDTRLHHYLHFGKVFNGINWRPHKPERIYEAIEGLVQTGTRRLY
jgi:hypothetical protein